MLKESGIQAGWVWFSACRRGECVVAMVVAGSGKSSKLLLPPCFWSFLLLSNPLLTQHPRRFACN